MLRLYMQVWQPGTEKKASKKILRTWKAVFKNVRFRSWSSKPVSVNAALAYNYEKWKGMI